MEQIERLEKIIEESLKDMNRLIHPECNETLKSRIIIPQYSQKNGEDNRYSEQELKCIFLSKIEQDDFFYYSVETPTKDKYCFKGNNPKVYSVSKGNINQFVSARFDVSIYKDREIKDGLMSHLEFKYGNCKQTHIKKDFLKILFEADLCAKNYFVHYVKSSDKRTERSIVEKYQGSIKYIADYLSDFSWEEKKNKITIFLLLGKRNDVDGKILKFSIGDQNNLEPNLEGILI